MAYGLILLAAAIVLAVRYARIDRASPRSKWLVGGSVLASLIIFGYLPGWRLAAMLLQLGVCVYVILYEMVTDELAKPDDPRSLGIGAVKPDAPPDHRPPEP